jgi:hypothetical protein
MQSQLETQQGRMRELPTFSKQQPGGLPRRRPMGVDARIAAVVLAALGMALVLCYAAGCAMTIKNGYTEMGLHRQIEDLRAGNALLGYQINVAQSAGHIEQEAARLGLRAADPVREVDYITCPGPEADMQLAAADSMEGAGGIGAAVAGYASRVVGGGLGARAEASTATGHRR